MAMTDAHFFDLTVYLTRRADAQGIALTDVVAYANLLKQEWDIVSSPTALSDALAVELLDAKQAELDDLKARVVQLETELGV